MAAKAKTKQRRHGLIDFLVMAFKINMQSVMEYRLNFIILAFGMFLNDVAFLVFWIIVYGKFHTINGWGFNNIILLQAIIAIGWGFASFFLGNWNRIADIVSKGALDYYLTLPKPVLLHLLVTRSSFAGVGDMLFGLVLGTYALSSTISSIPLFILLIVLSTIILISFGVVIGSLIFFIGGQGELQETLQTSLLLLSTYPFSIFGGAAKILLLIAIPVGFITGVPVLILNNFNPLYLGYMFIATAASAIVAYAVFRFGLRRYESGNAINVQI